MPACTGHRLAWRRIEAVCSVTGAHARRARPNADPAEHTVCPIGEAGGLEQRGEGLVPVAISEYE